MSRISEPEAHPQSLLRSAIFLIGIAGLILLSPVVEVVPGPAALLSILWAVTIVTCAFSVSVRWVERGLALALGAVWLASALWPDVVLPVVGHFWAAFFFGFTALMLLRRVLHTTQIDARALADALSVYLLLGMVWASLYSGIYALGSEAFLLPNTEPDYAAVHLIYFSFTTLTTLGLGDILPLSPLARILVAAEAVTGTLYLAVMVAGLVGLYRSAPKSDE